MLSHRLIVIDPGHFHAALCLREAHPRLDRNVHVYAPGGPDLDRFIEIVTAFNKRVESPTDWQLHITRTEQPVDRALADRPGDIAVIAGRNNSKIQTLARLHEAGIAVLADKPLVVAPDGLAGLDQVTSGGALMMEIMTGRRDIANRVIAALVRDPEIFGRPVPKDQGEAVSITNTHYLYKIVNGRPLVRPPWYFDTAVQGAGIVDVTTHLIDIVQWLLGDETLLELDTARQEPVRVSRQLFKKITGEDEFPGSVQANVQGNDLEYYCNGMLKFRANGCAVSLESLWGQEVAAGGGDTHRYVMRGTEATITLDLDGSTGFCPNIRIMPHRSGAFDPQQCLSAIKTAEPDIPPVTIGEIKDGWKLHIPPESLTTHEQHFAEVFDNFLNHVDEPAANRAANARLRAKYRFLMAALENSLGR